MKRDKKLYKHIYNFVKLREMDMPSAFEYQKKYELQFIDEDIDDAFFKGGIINGNRYTSSGRGHNWFMFHLLVIVSLILAILDIIPSGIVGKILMFVSLIAVYLIGDILIDHIARSVKADYLYIVHMNSLNGGQRDERY